MPMKKKPVARGSPFIRVTRLLVCLLAPCTLWPQVAPLLPGPGGTRPDLPNFAAPRNSPGNILPVISLPELPTLDSLFTNIRIPVRDVLITGSTVLTESELDQIAAPYLGKQNSFADLARLRDQLTLAYIQRGYVSSGAVIPDQSIRDGVVEIAIMEGKLAAVEVNSNGRLRRRYILGRLEPLRRRVVNVNEVEQALQVLRQNPRVRGVKAELAPADMRGESLLRVEVAEAQARNTVLHFDNYQPLSVGSTRGMADFTHLNATGRGDTISGAVRFTGGLRAFHAGYTLPLNARDTVLILNADVARSDVVQAPFQSLDIQSRMETWGLTLLHPLRRAVDSQFDVFVTAEVRRSQSFLLGSGFRFTDDLTEDGIARVSVVRLGQSWSKSGTGQALAMRHSISFGLSVFGATSNAGNVADSRFVSWLGQAQWARRVPALGSGGQVIIRGDVQLTNSPLPGLEKFAIGGRATVRGYRENEMVRDNGMVGSVEARIPVLARLGESSVLELAPFVDVGRSWNKRRPLEESETLPSAGIGLRWRVRSRLQAEAYWGHAFRNFPGSKDFNLQDRGIHLGLTWSLP